MSGKIQNLEERYAYNKFELPELVCSPHPDWVEAYNETWRIAFRNIEYPVKPGWKPQMSCMPGSGIIWQWDSCLMSLFARYANDLLPVMNNLDNLYRLQSPEGFISMAYRVDDESPAYGTRINPPLFAWVEWEYFLLTGDDSRFERIFPGLEKYYEWIKRNRTRPSGLYWFEDSGSSGMDNSPRGGYFALHEDGSDICFLDLACQQALSALYLSKIAASINLDGKKDFFMEEHGKLAALINRMHWSEKHGIYFDLFSSQGTGYNHNYLNHKTVAAFWPVLSGVAGPEQVRRLLEHLKNPDEFKTPHPVPSLSRDDPNYDPLGGYWRGGVWAPTNYMVVRGLASRGFYEDAREIASAHLDALASVMNNSSYGSIWECYSPEYMRPANKAGRGDTVRADFVGWSGLGPVSMLIENILGFGFDAPGNLIDWDARYEGTRGIKNLSFNGKKVSLVCSEEEAGGRRISVETTGKINICLRLDESTRTLVFEKGKHELVI